MNASSIVLLRDSMAPLFSATSMSFQVANALVLLMQEGLRRQLGEIDFRRAYPKRRLPAVLSRQECRRLFAELGGTERLMAECGGTRRPQRPASSSERAQ